MGAAAHERWNRTEGVMVAPGLEVDQVQEHLVEAAVVARLEWYPATEHLLSVTVATDASGRVAVTPPSRGGVVPGPTLGELVNQLGTAFGADVLMEGAAFTPEGRRAGAAAQTTAEEAAADPEEWADHDARTVVLTRLPHHALPLHADLLERPLSVLEHAGYRIVMTAGPGRELGSYGWDDEAFPVLRLQVDAEDRTAMLLTDTEEVAIYSWEMASTVVHGRVASPGPALRTMTETVLGDRTDAHAFAAALDVPPDDVAAAMAVRGAAGLAGFVRALELPEVLVDVLEGRTDPTTVPGAAVHQPGLTGAVGRSVNLRLAERSGPASGFWRVYRRLSRRRPGIVGTVVAGEIGLGAALLVRGLRAGAHRRGARARTAVGTALVLDALVGLSLTQVARATAQAGRQ